MYIHRFIIGFFICVNQAFTQDFNIEEEGLKPLPKQVGKTVLKTFHAQNQFEFMNCKLIGKAINLSNSKKDSSFVVTTSNACGWGASSGPVWVVSKIENSYTSIMHTITNGVEFKEEKNNRLRQIVTEGGSAGHWSYARWGFTGKYYKKLESYVFLPDDEELCKAHQDICPFETSN